MFLALLLVPADSLDGSSVLEAYDDGKKPFDEWRPSDDDVAWAYSPEGWKVAEPDVNEIYLACDAPLGLGDLDVLDALQCERFATWLDVRLRKPVSPHLRGFYSRALDLARRAVDLNSALIVEF